MVNALIFGWVVAFAVASLLLLFFSVLPRFAGNRRTLRFWQLAFLGLAAFLFPLALVGLRGAGMIGRYSPELLEWAILPSAPGQMLFLTAVAIAAIRSTGRSVPDRTATVLCAGAIILGAVTHQFLVEEYLTAFLTVGLILGPVQFLFRAARGARRGGLRALAVAVAVFMVVVATFTAWDLWTVLDPSGRVLPLDSPLRLLLQLRPYFYALVILVLGAGVVILTIQDAILEISLARETSLRVVGASEARLRRIIEAAGEAILTFSSAHLVELVNHAAARLFRMPASDIVGLRLEDLVEVDEGDWTAALAPVRAGGARQVTLTGLGRRPDDAAFPVECTIGAQTADGEGAGGGVAILRDLSQRLADEAERERFERRIAESEKMLAIGRVVSGVAHELNNPLAVVLGQSEQLVAHGDEAELRDGMRLINEQAERARHIVRDLLAFVRQRDEQREVVDLGGLVRRLVAAQRGDADARGVTLKVIETDGVTPVLVDRLALEQVIVNLIDNAIDATDAGAHVRLLLRRHAGKAELTVEDEGPGVPEEHAERIFEPFFTTKPVGEGTGLGLSVSTGLVERLGGTLRLENRPAPGVGAQFVVRLPLAPDDAIAGHVTATGAVTAPTLDSGQPGSVLIVDDEPSVRTTLARIFRRWGWSVVEEAEGASALERLASAPRPDVILCDLRMPGMNGEAFFDALGLQHRELRDRVVFVTGDVVAPETTRFLATAGRPVVEKPFTIAELSRVIREVLAVV